MSNQLPKFLGQGWQFPPVFNVPLDEDGFATGPGTAGMIAGDADIHESLQILFSTFRGERILKPDYGVGIEEHVFDPTDETQLGDLRSQIEHAILFFEPRIKLSNVTLDTSEVEDGVLNIRIEYIIPAINSRSNMVYPVYFKEGTNIRAR